MAGDVVRAPRCVDVADSPTGAAVGPEVGETIPTVPGAYTVTDDAAPAPTDDSGATSPTLVNAITVPNSILRTMITPRY